MCVCYWSTFLSGGYEGCVVLCRGLVGVCGLKKTLLLHALQTHKPYLTFMWWHAHTTPHHAPLHTSTVGPSAETNPLFHSTPRHNVIKTSSSVFFPSHTSAFFEIWVKGNMTEVTNRLWGKQYGCLTVVRTCIATFCAYVSVRNHQLTRMYLYCHVDTSSSKHFLSSCSIIEMGW